MVSSYLGHSGARSHLHPELADESGGESAVLLCHHCVDKDKPPKMPVIANNIDYGVLSRIDVPLKQPSDLGVMLMSAVRLCHMVTEVSSKDCKGGLNSIPRVTIPHR